MLFAPHFQPRIHGREKHLVPIKTWKPMLLVVDKPKTNLFADYLFF